jgi:Cytochrome bd terminal oxidase subunit I
MRASGMVLLAAAQGGGQVVPARAQMAATLGFHIILACFGIALPSIVLLAEFIGLRRGNETAMRLARRWSQVMGALVAVGAVTGTVLSLEMGLLWPGLMRLASLSIVVVVYGVMGAATIAILLMLSRRWRRDDRDEAPVPYRPPPILVDQPASQAES